MELGQVVKENFEPSIIHFENALLSKDHEVALKHYSIYTREMIRYGEEDDVDAREEAHDNYINAFYKYKQLMPKQNIYSFDKYKQLMQEQKNTFRTESELDTESDSEVEEENKDRFKPD